MDRITITRMTEEGHAGAPVRKVVGWFDRDAAEKFTERREAFDGANLAGVHLRDQNAGQVLYRTAGGRWVLMGWSKWQGAVDTWEYIGVADAREWLIINGEDDETMARLFGAPPEPERGPGRPQLGERVEVRIPPAMLDAIDGVKSVNAKHDDEWAEMPRAEVIRRLLMRALYGDAAGTDPARIWRERLERIAES